VLYLDATERNYPAASLQDHGGSYGCCLSSAGDLFLKVRALQSLAVRWNMSAGVVPQLIEDGAVAAADAAAGGGG
jgi:hypothetical protein